MTNKIAFAFLLSTVLSSVPASFAQDANTTTTETTEVSQPAPAVKTDTQTTTSTKTKAAVAPVTTTRTNIRKSAVVAPRRHTVISRDTVNTPSSSSTTTVKETR